MALTQSLSDRIQSRVQDVDAIRLTAISVCRLQMNSITYINDSMSTAHYEQFVLCFLDAIMIICIPLLSVNHLYIVLQKDFVSNTLHMQLSITTLIYLHRYNIRILISVYLCFSNDLIMTNFFYV